MAAPSFCSPGGAWPGWREEAEARGRRLLRQERPTPRGAGCCGGQVMLPRAGCGEPAGTARAGPLQDARAGLRSLPCRAGLTRAGRGRRADRLCQAVPLPGDAPGAGRIGFFSGSSRCLGASATSESGSLSLSKARAAAVARGGDKVRVG